MLLAGKFNPLRFVLFFGAGINFEKNDHHV